MVYACLKDVIMNPPDGSIRAYTAGKYYDVRRIIGLRVATDDQGNKNHGVNEEFLAEYFKLLSVQVFTVGIQ